RGRGWAGYGDLGLSRQCDGLIRRRLAPYAESIALAQAQAEVRILLAQAGGIRAVLDLHHPQAPAIPLAGIRTQPTGEHDFVAMPVEIGEVGVLVLLAYPGATRIILQNPPPPGHDTSPQKTMKGGLWPRLSCKTSCRAGRRYAALRLASISLRLMRHSAI